MARCIRSPLQYGAEWWRDSGTIQRLVILHSSIYWQSRRASLHFYARVLNTSRRDPCSAQMPDGQAIGSSEFRLRRHGTVLLGAHLPNPEAGYRPASMVNLLKATPNDQPSPLPARDNDTSPLVIACADALLSAEACASAVA